MMGINAEAFSGGINSDDIYKSRLLSVIFIFEILYDVNINRQRFLYDKHFLTWSWREIVVTNFIKLKLVLNG